jgi:hypothetical protein
VGFVEVADTTASARLRCDHPQKARARNIPAVIIRVLTQHYARLQRNLLYTGVTRGKKLDRRRRSPIGVRNVSGRRRWSKLSEWLWPKSPVSRQFGMAS